ncbi:MAG: hypothetical protein H7Y28_10440 [Rhodoferax sp.]|nr:hypothetical protein [Rhodoferax sp.]
MKIIHTTVSMALMLLVATGCGGGSSGYNAGAPATVSGTDVPVAATTDAGAVITFSKQQLAATSESTDPLILGNALLAVDDSAEPASI